MLKFEINGRITDVEIKQEKYFKNSATFKFSVEDKTYELPLPEAVAKDLMVNGRAATLKISVEICR